MVGSYRRNSCKARVKKNIFKLYFQTEWAAKTTFCLEIISVPETFDEFSLIELCRLQRIEGLGAKPTKGLEDFMPHRAA